MNWRKPIFLAYASGRGYRFPSYLSRFQRDSQTEAPRDTATRSLRELLRHCSRAVPYYAELMRTNGVDPANCPDPRDCLQHLPVLTKDTIRAQSTALHSTDLHQRKWAYNTSGGSTGEPIRLIQDADYHDRSNAVSMFFGSLLGCEPCDPVIRLWGSEKDIECGTRGRKARFFNWLTGTTWLNAFRMSPEEMRGFIQTINRQQPRLLVAYAQAIYELARFAEREKLVVAPQRAILTSAGTLYPFMREKIVQVFDCEVYNSYGSREVSDIACELPGLAGLWVAPWGNFVEIVDEDNQPVPPGTEGNILLTCLTNYAMPLLRYRIGDRGALLPDDPSAAFPGGQVLKHVSGRNVDVFRTRDQTLVDGEYFTHLLYFRPWVWKFQVIQKSPEQILFKVIKAEGEPRRAELEEITAKTRLVMGGECRVDFEFADELPPHPSGKFRYTISEVTA